MNIISLVFYIIDLYILTKNQPNIDKCKMSVEAYVEFKMKSLAKSNMILASYVNMDLLKI